MVMSTENYLHSREETIPSEESYYDDRQEPLSGSSSSSSVSEPILQMPNNGTTYANQDDVFIKWLFDHKSRTIPPLKMAWRGLEWSDKDGAYVSIAANGKSTAIMNELGITWASSLLESYFTPVFLATNMSVRNYNFRMRTASRFIIMNLSERSTEFGLRESDIDRVAEEIESKISALLAGAINDGYRRWLSTQTHIQENKVYGISHKDKGNLKVSLDEDLKEMDTNDYTFNRNT